MSKGFVHSVKVPRLYKTIAGIVQKVQENGESLKQLIYQQRHTNLQGVYALACNTIRHGDQLNQLIRKTQILFKEQRLDPWLTRVLITELIWGKQCLKSESKPIQTVLSYEKELREEVKNLTEDVDPLEPRKVRKPRYVRVNTLMMSVDEAINGFSEEGWNLLPASENYPAFLEILSNLNESTFIQDFHIPELLVFPHGTTFFNHPAYKTGEIILQDKASCFPVFLLNPLPGSSVLDMCSAPGMKSTQLAAVLQNKGKVVSVEMDARRYKTLCDFVQRTNSTCVETINKDALTIDSKQYPNVEYILVDPSCSGTGMVDREEINGRSGKCAPGRLKSLQSFQVLLLRHALLNFPSVKKVVYSTCSIHPEENEHVIDEILTDIGQAYELKSAKKILEGNWINCSSLDFACKDNCLYARPEVDLTNGFFVAVFERNFDVPLPEYKRKSKINREESSNFKNFEENSLNENPEGEWNEENEENEGRKFEDQNGVKKVDKTSERQLTASQKKRMRRRRKFGMQNLETSEQKVNEECTLKEDEIEAVQEVDGSKKTKHEKKEKQKLQNDTSLDLESLPQVVQDENPKKKKKKSKVPQEEIEVLQQEEDSVKSEKKKKRRKHKESSDFISLSVEADNAEIENPTPKKKKKKVADDS